MLFKSIRFFLTVADRLSFSDAAKELFISQPTLSVMISKMEEELGIKLFERSTRSVKLTSDGEEFYQICSLFITQCDEIVRRNSANKKIGRLSIGFGDVVDKKISQRIALFESNFPDIKMSIKFYSTVDCTKAIDFGEVDIGFISSFTRLPPEYNHKLIIKKQLHVVVWKGHRLSNKKSVRLEQLKSEPFLFLYRKNNLGIDRLNELCAKAGFKPIVAQETNDFRIMFMLVSQKKGIAFNMCYDEVLDNNNLVSIPLDLSLYENLSPNEGLIAVWLKNNKNPVLDFFIDYFNKL